MGEGEEGRDNTYGTEPPRFEDPIDLEARLKAVPSDATVKGMFPRDVVSVVRSIKPRADLFAAAGLEPRRLLPFFDYPFEMQVRLMAAATELCWPGLPLGQGFRRFGQRAYNVLLGHNIGRVIFAALGRDFGRIVSVGAKGWKVGVGFGRVTFESLAPRHGAYHFKDLPGFIGTYQVGVIEGAMLFCGVTGDVWVRVDAPGQGVIEFWWT